MTGLLNLFGLCTMEQLHRNMDEVVGVKQQLARREAEIGELHREVARTMSAFRDERERKEKEMERVEMELAECQDKLNRMQADLENTERLYQDSLRKLRKTAGSMGAYKQQRNAMERKLKEARQ